MVKWGFAWLVGVVCAWLICFIVLPVSLVLGVFMWRLWVYMLFAYVLKDLKAIKKP